MPTYWTMLGCMGVGSGGLGSYVNPQFNDIHEAHYNVQCVLVIWNVLWPGCTGLACGPCSNSPSFLSIFSCSLWTFPLVCSTLCVYLGSLFSEASLPHSSSADGLSVSLSFRQWSAIGRSGWEGSIRSMSFLRRSVSRNCTSARPLGNLGS